MFSTSTPKNIMINRLRLLGMHRGIDYEIVDDGVENMWV